MKALPIESAARLMRNSLGRSINMLPVSLAKSEKFETYRRPYCGTASMSHLVDSIGYPQDPELRKLEFQLGDLAALWRGAFDDPNRQCELVATYHAILARLYALGWDAILDVESELPDRLMPDGYRERNGRSKQASE